MRGLCPNFGGPAGPVVALLAWIVAAIAAPMVSGQATSPTHRASLSIDSGVHALQGEVGGLPWAEVVHVPGAAWVRLHFGPGTQVPAECELVLTSALDGAEQRFTGASLQQWSNGSAYFNGDTVLVELVVLGRVPGDERPARITISAAEFQLRGAPGDREICGPADDRVPSSDKRVGRTMPAQCTAFIIEDCARCMLSAGHCAMGTQVVQFNVPLSNPDGTLHHPGPDDQYAVDAASMQWRAESAGRDWAYFGCHPNVNTHLMPGQAQGEALTLLHPNALEAHVDRVRVTGYGEVGGPVDPGWNQTQLSGAGRYLYRSFFELGYYVDTSGGNSGSPVVLEGTNKVSAIHTTAGCPDYSVGNRGTSIAEPGLRAALDAPRGVCCAPPQLDFAFDAPLPTLLPPQGTEIAFDVLEHPGALYVPGSARLVIDRAPGVELVLDGQEVYLGSYVVQFPASLCGGSVAYYFTARSEDGRTFTFPPEAPANVFIAPVATGVSPAAEYDFEVEAGWSVVNGVGLTDGAWERGVPLGEGLRGDPAHDHDGSGACWLTGNRVGNADVDGGPTQLISPPIDLTTATRATLSYARWFFNDTAPTDQDRLVVEVSDDDGATWRVLEQASHDPKWRVVRFDLADHVDLPGIIRVRFVASDQGGASILEAAVDRVRVDEVSCDAGCPGDISIDGVVNLADLVILLHQFGGSVPAGTPADLDEDLVVGLSDLQFLLSTFGEACGP